MMYDFKFTILKNTFQPRAIFKKMVLCCLFSFVTQAVFSQVTTSIDTTSIKIGEELRIQFEVEADSLDLVVFPDMQTFAPLEVIESYATDTSYNASKIKYRKQYGLTQFDSGSYTIPRQKIIFNNKFYLTDSINVEVRDVVVDTTKQKLFDIKPEIGVEKPPFNFLPWLYWLLFLILVAAVIFYFIRRKKIREAAQRQLPPYEEAIVALQELDKSNYLLQNNAKEYYSLLTEIVKRYLDREVDEAAQESTTNELIERLNEHKKAGNFDFDTEDIRKLEGILKRADLIKFARMQQASGQAEADRNAVEEIITHTHEAIPEPTEEELLQDELYREQLLKKQKRKKIIKGVTAGLSAAILVLTVNIALNGFDTTMDNMVSFFGGKETMKEKLEGRWFKSEYGSPAVIIETPDILVRKPLPISEELTSVIDQLSYFESGEIGDDFYVAVTISTYNEEVMQGEGFNLENSLESSLRAIEARGAMNMVVKREDFNSDNGVTGLKAYGDFNFKEANGTIRKDKVGYQVVLFSQGATLQMVTLVYNQDKEHANQIKERIVNSIEIEVTKNQQTPQNGQ